MIGTGVFTSLGFQLLDIQSAPVIILLWVVGGMLALCGSFCYAELGSSLPRSGGEYHFLGRIYHPAVGFISGWVSSTIGFAAPTALAAITSATYLATVWTTLHIPAAAAILVVLVAIAHMGSRVGSSRFQLVFTGLKVLLIIGFIISALLLTQELQNVRWMPEIADTTIIASGGFAIALIYVNYAYTGWNAATYLVGELEQPTKSLPRVLIIGTTVVTGLYVLLHIMFLSVAPMSAMEGKLEIGFVVAGFAFGTTGAQLVGIMLALLLISTVSAMVLAGPRALQVIGQDFGALSILSKENQHGIPFIAIGTQTLVTLLLVITAAFDAILVFASFTLALNTLLSVAGIWVLRRREPNLPRPFRVPWYPWPVVFYVGLTFWTLMYVLFTRPVEAAFALGLIFAGWLFWWFARDNVGHQ